MLPLCPAEAQESRYRVEVLVLTHIDHAHEPREARTLEDFSSALDFLTPPSERPEEDPVTGKDELPGAAPAELPEAAALDSGAEAAASPEDGGEEEEIDPLDVVIHLEEMGPEMQEAWRRLRLSAPFRPLQYLAWEQGSREPFPVLRIHDLETVLVEDPWAEQRLALENPDETFVFGDTVADADSPESETDQAADALPDPIAYYRLDGTVRLIRTRFLHLSMAIEWREPVFEEVLSPRYDAAPAALRPAEEEAPAVPWPSAYLVHRLEQSRPIRTGRMEYFDGPVLGLLAWITDISDTMAPETTE